MEGDQEMSRGVNLVWWHSLLILVLRRKTWMNFYVFEANGVYILRLQVNQGYIMRFC